MSNNLAPIVLFVYRRPEHTKRTLESLAKNELASESVLYIFSEEAKSEKDEKDVKKVRDYIESVTGFKDKTIIKRESHLGLGSSIIRGVTEVIEQHSKVIVMEDDLISSPFFLKFINKALEFYDDDPNILSATGFCFPITIPENYKYEVYISPRPNSLGWATWKEKWKLADWEVKDFEEFINNKKAQMLFNKNGKDLTAMLYSQMKKQIDSWAIRWAYTHYKQNAYCLHPIQSLIEHIGGDNLGTHAKTNLKRYDVTLETIEREYKLSHELVFNETIQKQINKLFEPSIIRKVINFFKLNFLK